MKNQQKKLTLVLAPFVFLLCVLSFCMRAHADYEFTRITDSDGPFTTLGSRYPSLNNEGEVAFKAFLDGGGSGIYKGDGGPLTEIADSNDFTFSSFGDRPAINDSGDVAFKGSLDAGGSGIFVSDGGPLVTIEDDSGPFSSFVSADISNSGLVTYRAIVDGGGGISIVSDSGPSHTTIVNSTGQFSNLVEPSINSSGTVAFWGSLSTGPNGIFYGNGGSLTTVVDSDGDLSFVSTPTIIDSGIISYLGSLDTGTQAIFIDEAGSKTTVADSDGPFSGFDLYPAVNSKSEVAFGATLDVGGRGIFVGPDAVADRVIGTDDSLDGSTVTGLRFGQNALNEIGEIVFAATLADGRTGIYRADPDSDEDGTLDRDDGCPNDPAKLSSGACGCGVADADSDGDGTLNCNESCPNDPNKLAPGACGCGEADIDANSNGIFDCDVPSELTAELSGKAGVLRKRIRKLRRFNTNASPKKKKKQRKKETRVKNSLADLLDFIATSGSQIILIASSLSLNDLTAETEQAVNRATRIKARRFSKNKKEALKNLDALLAALGG